MNFSAQTIGILEITIALIGLFGIGTIILLKRHSAKPNARKRDLLVPIINLIRGLLGWFLIVIGVIITPLPIPLGIVIIIMGIAVLGPRSRRLRLLFYHARRSLRHLARTAPPFIRQIAHIMLEFERKVTATYRHRNWERKPSVAHPTEPSRSPTLAGTSPLEQPPESILAASLPDPKPEPIWRGVDDANNDFRHSEQETAR